VDQPLLHVRDVAELLGLSTAAVYDATERGDIPGFRLYGRKGGPLRFDRAEIQRWLVEICRVGTVPTDSDNGPAATDTAPAPAPEGDASDAIGILRPLEPE
jgi:excisionase family DNA binding protein